MIEYYIPTQHSQTELVEKRSRFIGQVWRVSSEEEARARIEETKKKHYDARHNCWCYRLREGGVERYSDDGEPQGTAGQPMLNVFQRENVNDVVCVVTRYFGGILLGAGGLVRAYSAAAKDALDGAGISVVRRWVAMEVPCTYAQFEGMRREIGSFGGVVEAVDYGVDVVLSALLPEERAEDFAAHILDVSAGTVEALEAGEAFKDVPWRLPTADES
ncbi:IMPACT family member yigZ [uncultured Clostridium sp.]|uniref:YigZ family protein n=1 Tax=Flintibacter hominis TaxID=2763048 RepID=A0A8J6J776_9FIRM|nr:MULTISPECIES: YigZ family protein [Eubacteriales]MBS5591184.1 YigZ family protein [Clostridiales bacterium]SCH46780.1 IMPACT family member yigZ [uncultured Clostridium sp.]SCJ26817.1 IMPACT family member yigZ [uncultured Flavonifractor sp.]MBC5721755.1 YigZ family protein [Flintibacter hominis]MCU6702920.1 YigZ family protein [Muriventricola aceti]